MSLFFFNVFRSSEELLPPQLRKPRMIAWFRTILSPIRYLSDKFNDDFCKGCDYPDYDNSTAYVKYDRVIWQDGAVYELKVTTSTGVKPTGSALSATNWLKYLDDFMGVDEKKRINGQLIIFEPAINRRFRVTAPPYIYVESIVVGASQAFVRIKVPLAVYTALGPNNTARDNRIIEFAEKYVMGDKFLVVTSY